MHVAVSTDIGKIRENNQDSYYLSKIDEFPLFIIADGMGGHKAGEVASSLAVETIKNIFTEKKELLLNENTKIIEFIEEAIDEANRVVFQKANLDSDCNGMGTTITMAYLCENKVFIGHVGDSRAYLLRGNEFIQLTEDHSLVAELVRKGSISKEEAVYHPQKNIITRALGTDEKIKTDIVIKEVFNDDILLLCTDGLTNMVNEGKIKNTLQKEEDLEIVCNDLVTMANDLGGLDNITVIAVKIA